ncbi:hypothetical protein, partial [Enterococcus faecium]|uniref:hypothetical protein n=1 Tax=Enterococcus faecium TaxID=1352 RepID=UPI00195531D7
FMLRAPIDQNHSQSFRTLAVKESIFYFNIGYFKINGLRYSSTKATLSIIRFSEKNLISLFSPSWLAYV